MLGAQESVDGAQGHGWAAMTLLYRSAIQPTLEGRPGGQSTEESPPAASHILGNHHY